MATHSLDFASVHDLAAFAASGSADKFQLLGPAMSAVPAAIALSGAAHPALIEEHRQRARVAAPCAYAIPGHLYGGMGFLRQGESVFLEEDCVPAYFRQSLTPEARLPEFWEHGLFSPRAELVDVAVPCAAPLHPNLVYGHFLLEILPKLWLLAMLRRMGRFFPVVASTRIPDWVKSFLAFYYSSNEIVWYDSQTQIIRAPYFITTSMLKAAYFFHPAMNIAVADLMERVGGRQPASAGTRLFLSRRRFHGGRFSTFANESKIAGIMERAGFAVIYPEEMSIPDQISLYKNASYIACEYGSAAHNSIFAPPSARVIVFNRLNEIQSRICALRAQDLGIVEPVGGFRRRDNSAPETNEPFEIDPLSLQALLRRMLEPDQAG